METLSPTAARPPSLLDLAQPPGATPTVARHWTGRAQNFAVAWHQAGPAAASAACKSTDETLLIVLDAPVGIAGAGGDAQAPARSICILPPGTWQLNLRPGATCVVLSSLREGVAAGALNETAYAERDPRIAPVGPPWRALRSASEVRIFSIDSIAAPKDKPRLKMLQTATLSINWVEYEGPRDRRALSPHSHTSFEQGSLALAGDFVHHLRVDWGQDADAWQADQHARLGSPSLMVVPVHTIHTSEGVGPGRHLLIDVFSPPRTDFIAKGWVANSGDYAAPETTAA
jgi:hypothetical protein